MGYSTSPGYIGPDEIWRRFMAGFTITYENVCEDDSVWVIRPMTRYHVDRLDAMFRTSKRDIINEEE